MSAVSAFETVGWFSRREDFWIMVAARSEDERKSGRRNSRRKTPIRDIRRATRRHFSAEEKIRVVLEGLRGEESIAELCRREGMASSMYYGSSKSSLRPVKGGLPATRRAPRLPTR